MKLSFLILFLVLSVADTENPRQNHFNKNIIAAQHRNSETKENKDTRIQNASFPGSKQIGSAKESVNSNSDPSNEQQKAGDWEGVWKTFVEYIRGIVEHGPFTAITTFATVLLAIFTYQIVANSRALQRAYIEVNFPNEFTLEPDIECVFVYEIGNTGPTRARIKVIRSITYIGPDWPTSEPLPNQKLPNQYILPAHTKFNRNVRIRSLSSGELAEINSGQIKLIVHGFVIYQDIFKCRRFSRFCRIYEPPIRRFIPPREFHAQCTDDAN